MSRNRIIGFASRMLQLYPPYRWDDEQEKAWAETLLRELYGFSDQAIERAEREIIRRKKKATTPTVGELIDACVEAKQWIEAERRSNTLPSLTEKSKEEGEFGEAREEVVWNVLMKMDLAKQAAKEGWIGMLVPYCYKHGKLPMDKAEIAELKREAKAIDTWDGRDPIVAKNKIILLEKRQELSDRVLGRR